MKDNAQMLRSRLRGDLQSAMRDRKSKEMSVLRGLIAAIDNAQAVPVGDLHANYAVHAFGDKSVEAPRRQLSRADLDRLLVGELEARTNAAGQYRRVDRHDRADELEREAEIISRYLDATADP